MMVVCRPRNFWYIELIQELLPGHPSEGGSAMEFTQLSPVFPLDLIRDELRQDPSN